MATPPYSYNPSTKAYYVLFGIDIEVFCNFYITAVISNVIIAVDQLKFVRWTFSYKLICIRFEVYLY